ncbi:MAG: type II toxin-antitoxin system VapC family toxin [Gammaproteobacteria bacterium]|nr:type II toxin-antitoxin system VapC family toxin [Gammaproteobacteria bacterium]
MRFLLDTHVLLWVANSPERLSRAVCDLLQESDNEIYFSIVSLWEIAIKKSLAREDFQVDARILHRALCDEGYKELGITSEHVVSIDSLPLLHKDPFDRLLISQATVEGITLLTKDELIAAYSGRIQKI